MNKVFIAGSFVFNLEEKTHVMGILNITPDSFSDGNKWFEVDSAVAHALEMQDDGADIIDIGAQSTRPGCIKISVKEELERLIPVLAALKDKIFVPISVDTFYPEVAQESIKYGVSIINDVSGFKNEKMLSVASKSNCGCIVMYDGEISNMKSFFEKQISKMQDKNIKKERICLDPGIGFGKNNKENLCVIKNFKKYLPNNYASLIGASRKRVIGMACGEPQADKRDYGTIAAHTIAILNGANIIRVHNVKAAIQAAKVTDSILKSSLEE